MNLIKTQNPWFPAIVDELFNTSWSPAAPHKGGTLPAVNIIEEGQKRFRNRSRRGCTKRWFAVQ
jgi:hypothetical protein